MIKIFNEQSDLLEFKKSNIYDFTKFDTIIIKFDFSTKCIIKANKILCQELTASSISCSFISSSSNITCNSIKAISIICDSLLSNHVVTNNIEALEIKATNSISAYNIWCITILSLDIKCYHIKCYKCFTDYLNSQEDDIDYLYTFNEYCI